MRVILGTPESVIRAAIERSVTATQRGGVATLGLPPLRTLAFQVTAPGGAPVYVLTEAPAVATSDFAGGSTNVRK